MVKKAEELAKKNGWFLARQFENPANPEYHRNTTGPEILLDFVGRRLDWWVTGYGTGGTLTGASDILRKARPEIKIAVVEPEGAALLAGHEWKPHKIQGWTPDFIPAVLDRKGFDELVTVTDIEARDAARDLAAKEGIFCGISSGGTFAGAKKIAEKAGKGSVGPRDAPRHRRALPLDDPLRGNLRGERRRADGPVRKKRAGCGTPPGPPLDGRPLEAVQTPQRTRGNSAKPPSSSTSRTESPEETATGIAPRGSRQRPGCREWREPASRRDSRHPPARPSRKPSGTSSN